MGKQKCVQMYYFNSRSGYFYSSSFADEETKAQAL